MFNFERGSVHGEVETNESFEGRGLGSALLLMREAIIRDVMHRYGERMTSGRLKSKITDNSRSSRQGKNYEGWTSSLAQKMGYEQAVDEDKFVKIYQSNNENEK